jgi:hypothetical protein
VDRHQGERSDPDGNDPCSRTSGKFHELAHGSAPNVGRLHPMLLHPMSAATGLA